MTNSTKSVFRMDTSSARLPRHYEGWEVTGQNDLAGDPVAPKPNIRDLSGVPEADFDAVYCSHQLQTCYAHEVRAAVAGLRRLVRPSGFVEIRVPDVNAIMRVAVARNLDMEGVLYRSPAGPVTVRDAIYGFAKSVEKSPRESAHRVGFSRSSLRSILAAEGFVSAALLRPRALEIAVVAFLSEPTPEHRLTLGLK